VKRTAELKRLEVRVSSVVRFTDSGSNRTSDPIPASSGLGYFHSVRLRTWNTIFAEKPSRLLPDDRHTSLASGRLGRPEELAGYAPFMMSDRNSFMHGAVVIVDGGTVTEALRLEPGFFSQE
jgi:NAD(P)-dependent dehydrogenase (short-subunit alcohol dehydrogenase family)